MERLGVIAYTKGFNQKHSKVLSRMERKDKSITVMRMRAQNESTYAAREKPA